MPRYVVKRTTVEYISVNAEDSEAAMERVRLAGDIARWHAMTTDLEAEIDTGEVLKGL